MGKEVNLDKIREECGFFRGDTFECEEDYPDTCPFHDECKTDAEED